MPAEIPSSSDTPAAPASAAATPPGADGSSLSAPTAGPVSNWLVSQGFDHEVLGADHLGIETLGDFEERQSSHQVLFTTMIGLPKHFSLRLGIGGGLTRAAPDFTLHTSVLWRF